VELEFHQLDLRYEALRRRAPDRERRLLASLAQAGQQVPIVVVQGEGGAWVVVDGYKRVRALKRLKTDTVCAMTWGLAEAEALMLERMMRSAGADDAFEQGWLLRELHGRFGLAQEELGRRFDKSKSWVSRRLSLVNELPEAIQERVRRGELAPYAATKYLVPLARANRTACVKLVAALGKTMPTSRQLGALYGAWLGGNRKSRELLLAEPWLFLRAQEEAQRKDAGETPPGEQLLGALGALGALSRHASARVRQGLVQPLPPETRDQVDRCLAQARTDAQGLFDLLRKELDDARSESTHNHP